MRKTTYHVTMYKAYEELWEGIYFELIHDQSAVRLRYDSGVDIDRGLKWRM